MAFPVKAICERKDIRADGTCIIYLQFYARDGKRKMNTGLSIPPNFWNEKKRIVNEKLPMEYGLYTEINNEITRQLRLLEDLIQWAEEQHKSPIGAFIKSTFTPQLNLDDLKFGKNPTEIVSPLISVGFTCIAPLWLCYGTIQSLMSELSPSSGTWLTRIAVTAIGMFLYSRYHFLTDIAPASEFPFYYCFLELEFTPSPSENVQRHLSPKLHRLFACFI